jgi:hypothetical protein
MMTSKKNIQERQPWQNPKTFQTLRMAICSPKGVPFDVEAKVEKWYQPISFETQYTKH